MTWTRRDFLTASMFGIVASATFNRQAAGVRGAASFRVLRHNVGVFTARGGTIGWLLNDSGTLVVDSQYADTAVECLAGLRERGTTSIDALINTHHHADHTGGNGVFLDSARRIVAHDRAVALQRRVAASAAASADQTYADTTFETSWSAQLGDETIRARHYGAAHTRGDCTVFFERANVVHMGDLVFNRAYPFVDVDGGASVRGWVDLLEAVAAEHDADTIYIFGHARTGADVFGGREDILYQRNFLSAVLDTAERAIATGQNRAEATSLERLRGFADYAPLVPRLTLGAVIGAAFDELTAAR